AEVAAAADAAAGCCQGAPAVLSAPATLPSELALELSNVTADYSEADSSGDTSRNSEIFKRSVTRSVRIATPASCSPQPTIVELKPVPEVGEHTAALVTYQPACTRVQRCNGCCGSTLISCQPTQTEILQLRVNKVERTGSSIKRSHAIVEVEQHLACKCDCRIKESDCNAYQLYDKSLCRCQCQNTDARDKCLKQQEQKYWDDANCTCACRYIQNCTTGTYFDETACKCSDSAPTEVFDRKRFIVQAVAVETDNTTIYEV
ncbi:vascular endothelial growth factor A-A, partial [Scaptodrosophila lebanonensis]|uniref:Vascular endothelial growth factor A-A n=1 Tax=Drosophila lebanonensis TaxID=7225 RepID=A0A6J2U654_DROLE